MPKRTNYLGGSTLLGAGTVSKARGRRGGIGDSSAAVRDVQKAVKAHQQEALRAQVSQNQKLVRKLAKSWSEEKGKSQFVELELRARAIHSTLALALLRLRDKKG